MQKFKVSGFALLEVLVAMSIMAFSLLALLQFQLANLKMVRKTDLQAIAMMQLINFAQRLAANKSDAIRKSELSAWNDENSQLLLDGKGGWSIVAKNNCKLWVRWFAYDWQSISMHVLC